MLFSKIEFGIDTKLHLFDAVIKPILLYGCEVWGYENMEQIEVFHRYFLRRVLRVRKNAPKAMVYGELGEKELKYTVWKRMATFWKNLTNEGNSLAGLIYLMINDNDHENKWLLGVKNIIVNCGIPMVNTYINFVSDYEFKKYIKRKCEDLATQSWYSMLSTNSLCDCYMEFKHGLFLEPYLRKLKAKHRIQLSRFRCAPYISSGVKGRITGNHSQHCSFCHKECKVDEYHLLMVCETFRDKRVELIPKFFHSFPNIMKFDQLMNSMNIELLENLSVLCGAICNAGTSGTS